MEEEKLTMSLYRIYKHIEDTIKEHIRKLKCKIDDLEKERQADKEKIKELESDKEINVKMIDLMAEHLTTPIHSKKDVIKYFENLAKEKELR